jgi:uncharacterized membrane-anchored protein
MRSLIVILGCVASLGLVNYSIAKKEHLLAEGAVVYLELAPVDPRSLMQGDYMALNFRVRNSIGSSAPADGHIVAALDERRVGSFRRLHDGKPLAADEVLMRYRVRNNDVKFATNAFFFQEGTARRYEPARFGEFRVAPDGELLLKSLRDKDLKPL